MMRRVAFTLVVVSAIGATAPLAWAQTTTTAPVVTTTSPPTTAATTTAVPTTRERPVTTTAPAATSTTRATTTTVADNEEDDEGISGRTIALILAAIAVVVLLIIVVVLLMRRRDAERWWAQVSQAAAEGRSVLGLATHGLATLDQPALAAHTWSDLEAQGARLHQRLQGLARDPADEWGGTAVTRADQALQGLRSAVEADRALRLGPPAPTAEQLGYAEAVVRQRAADFEQELSNLDAALAAKR